MNSIINYHTTCFGELWDKSLFDLVKESIQGVFKSACIEKRQIDAVFFGNMLAGILENNLHSSSKIAEILKVNIPVFRVESACASGSIAFHLANQYLNSKSGKTVLVIGAEKMTDYPVQEITNALLGALSGEEQAAGLTFPGAYAMMAKAYMKKYGYGEKSLAYVSFKNHFHGSLNKQAHFQKKVTIRNILESPYIADPLKIFDCSPISDGACSLILTSDKSLIKKAKHSVSVLSCETATDTISLKKRKKIYELESTKIAADKAFKKAKLKRKDINVAEVHDCFSIAEILAMEDLGFWKKGKGGKLITYGLTMLGSNSKPIVNTSGGLKSAGHPVGATGVKQIGEIFLQLTNQAQNRQVKNLKYGLAHNIGGSGGTAVVTILGKKS